MSLDKILTEIQHSLQQQADFRDIVHLRDLIAALRPVPLHDAERATDNLRALCFVLRRQPEWRNALRHYLINVVTRRRLVHLLTDTGITINTGFWSAARERLLSKFLPPLKNDDYIKDVFGQIFDHPRDHLWVNGVSDQVWSDLTYSIGFRTRRARHTHAALSRQILSAAQVLSYRITTIGLEAELVRNYPEIERFESPFLRQNDEINNYVIAMQKWLLDRNEKKDDARHISILLDQAEEIAGKIRRTAAQNGVSVSLTRLLLRLDQSIARLRTLLALLDSPSLADSSALAVSLFKQLVTADNQRNSLRELMQSNTELLSVQITERAGKSGEHYVTSNRREWLEMLRSALGAGFIVGFMATIKVLLSKLVLAPFGYALLFSLNYSLGFMLVHILHFTIATKQPAMTAALIARAIDQGKQKLDELAELSVSVFRSQLIAIIGNIGLAMPTAYLIAWLWYGFSGHHLADPDKAHHLLHELDPISSLALPHAAIAGVCLFLSGLISGYYDNKASYAHIPERLRQLNWLRSLLGETRLNKVTGYIGDNLGALAGNFFFGIMLGSIGQLGSFFGLPIDIRHITFSSANLMFALVGLDHQIGWQVLLYSLAGVLLIGMVNLAVSFSLALMVALSSRRVSFGQRGTLLRLLWQRLWRQPRDFFLPPKEALPADAQAEDQQDQQEQQNQQNLPK